MIEKEVTGMCNHERSNTNIDFGCGCHGNAWRQFRTRDEKRTRLEEYREELRREIQAVEERIKDLDERA